jgi:hypothetical protein
MTDQVPLPGGSALRALIRCVGTTGVLLAHRRVHLPRAHVGARVRFADGTSARVYRETAMDRGAPEPASDTQGPLIHFHRLVNSRGTGLLAVRPDGYIGLRTGRAADPQLGRWLSRIGAAGPESSP